MAGTHIHPVSASFRLAWACSLLWLAACTQSSPENFNGTDISSVPWGGDFVLVNQDGNRTGLRQFEGKVVALFFGFTHCPDICSPTLARLADIRKHLGAEGSYLQVVFITVDPQHDTAAQLKEFLSQFDKTFVGLTGSQPEIDEVIRDYKVSFERHEERGVSGISHAGGVFLFDHHGKLRVFLREGMAANAMMHDIRVLIAGRE